MSQLPPGQLRVYRFLVAYVARTGRSPTLREIADGLGHNPSATLNRLRSLKRRGLVTWDQKRHGTLYPIIPEGSEQAEYEELVEALGEVLPLKQETQS